MWLTELGHFGRIDRVRAVREMSRSDGTVRDAVLTVWSYLPAEDLPAVALEASRRVATALDRELRAAEAQAADVRARADSWTQLSTGAIGNG